MHVANAVSNSVGTCLAVPITNLAVEFYIPSYTPGTRNSQFTIVGFNNDTNVQIFMRNPDGSYRLDRTTVLDPGQTYTMRSIG